MVRGGGSLLLVQGEQAEVKAYRDPLPDPAGGWPALKTLDTRHPTLCLRSWGMRRGRPYSLDALLSSDCRISGDKRL